MTISEALQPLLADLFELYGLEVVWASESGRGSSVLIANSAMAIYLSNDLRDRTLDTYLMVRADADALRTAIQSNQGFQVVSLLDGATSLLTVLEERGNYATGERSFIGGPSDSVLPNALGELLERVKQSIPDILSGETLLESIVPAAVQITVRRKPFE